MTTNAVDQLEAIGFSEHEARAYVALLKAGPLTGYQLAKVSGIPRPNIYPVLDRLQERGAVNRVSASGADRYLARPSETMLRDAEHSFSSHLQRARDALRELREAPAEEHVWNIDGYTPLIDRAQGVVDSAQRRLLACVWSSESAQLRDSIDRAVARGVDVTTLCVQGCAAECGNCAGRIYRYPIEGTAISRTLALVRDDAELLAGECRQDGSATGAVTKMRAFVDMAGQFILNTVAVAEVIRSTGTRLPRLLDDQARAAVRNAGLELDGASWIGKLLARRGDPSR
jgi:predicted transcriptional regulator